MPIFTRRTAPIIAVTQSHSSSGLGGYVVDALRRAGAEVEVVDVLASKRYKLWPVIKALRWPPARMWQRRWEALLFSSWAWRRNSNRNEKMIRSVDRPDSMILQIAKEYFPHAIGQPCAYNVFILYTMKLSLADGVTPWLPPIHDRDRFLALETELYQNARRVFTGGAYVKPHLVSEYGVDPARVVVAGGGAHPYYVEHAVKDAPVDFANRIIFVGWDFGMKGGRDLLEAFSLVYSHRPEIKLLIAGPDQSQWVQQAGVKWLGPVRSKDDLIALYRQCDLFVMPSLRDSFGYVFLEAMSQGVPCIGTNLNAMPEIIQHGKTGYIVPLHDAKTLAQRIMDYYNRPENRYEMGQAALNHVLSYYTWDAVAGRILEHAHLD